VVFFCQWYFWGGWINWGEVDLLDLVLPLR
jgi:hypothetical protein